MLLRQCFGQSRLRGGSSAPLTEVRGTCSLCFSTCGFMLVFFPGGSSRQTSFLFLTYGGEIVILFPLINARCVTTTSVAFYFYFFAIPDVPFLILLSTLIRSRFQAMPATLLIPIDLPFLFAVEELYGTRYQSGSFSLIYVGSDFLLPA